MSDHQEPCVSDFETLNNEYEIAMENVREWEFGLYDKYIKYEQYLIMSMRSYLKNIERGFGKFIDQKQFESIRKYDKSGALFAETLIGFELSKKCIILAPIIFKMKACKNMTITATESQYINACVACGVDMGSSNPRQFCRKTYCGNI